ncbi:Predicted 5' DNA nuclease, flap endonuclease-1-like, helix-3-turn-helix (H3TH) domain [Parasphingorhabdus marina DSM 22363]|uniref:Predicted 5' DNA nuclease, flap endonuclease-1-like, helix-3-turn-helix (H3TH) domain n=1 Tax=Parasphingorhabdus marina DSM 22363 TaxID=1123272 RepID=A0A1N6H6N7_9SPHN|nr:hypothetical protein [Parasphingorhabdus marina]SIO15429.1 Predicted 5' DNA nuclease, flap endonuclease-1-like, helix-3-turn-helix (H3TH) domain [Parasphingorhabdus marina DSM 22363]
MISLVSANWLLFLIALVLGVATAFWAWAASGREAGPEQFDADDGLLEKAGDAVPPAPEPESVTEVAEEPKAAPVAAPEPAPAPAPSPKPAPAARTKPVAAAATPTPKPRVRKPAKPTPPPPPPGGKPNIPQASGDPDNLRLIKGVGPKLNTLLNNLGITRFDQIAAWKEAEIAEVDQYLESFSGRITRDAWIDQAKYLAKDDIAGFEKKYGKL